MVSEGKLRLFRSALYIQIYMIYLACVVVYCSLLCVNVLADYLLKLKCCFLWPHDQTRLPRNRDQPGHPLCRTEDPTMVAKLSGQTPGDPEPSAARTLGSVLGQGLAEGGEVAREGRVIQSPL